jgi:hypothetical protein
MLQRTQECFGLKPQRLAADAAYGSGLMMQRGIEPHIPLLERTGAELFERTLKGVLRLRQHGGLVAAADRAALEEYAQL